MKTRPKTPPSWSYVPLALCGLTILATAGCQSGTEAAGSSTTRPVTINRPASPSPQITSDAVINALLQSLQGVERQHPTPLDDRLPTNQFREIRHEDPGFRPITVRDLQGEQTSFTVPAEQAARYLSDKAIVLYGGPELHVQRMPDLSPTDGPKEIENAPAPRAKAIQVPEKGLGEVGEENFTSSLDKLVDDMKGIEAP